MSELHVTKVANGYIVRTIHLFSKDPRELQPSETWVFPTLGAMNSWMKQQFAIRSQSDE